MTHKYIDAPAGCRYATRNGLRLTIRRTKEAAPRRIARKRQKTYSGHTIATLVGVIVFLAIVSMEVPYFAHMRGYYAMGGEWVAAGAAALVVSKILERMLK